MVNYQLYHTNVWLGGQMKYDLIIDSAGQDLVVSGFHISPISKSVAYNKYVKDDLLKRTHQENISRFYKEISGQFFNNIGNPELSGLQPIVSNDSNLDTHDDTYEMGCRRSSYQLYGKQFEFFVPLWLEYLPSDSYLNFQFEIYPSEDSESPICTKNLILKPVNNHYDFHNKFVKYLNDYFKYVGVVNGTSDVLNINPSKNIAVVSGLNVESGLTSVKNLPNLMDNLFLRELPLIEFDNMIISNMKDNHLITRQLYNFNLCFNINDILTNSLFDLIKGIPFIVKLKVGIIQENGETKVLEIRDFYTNYEKIPRKYCGPTNFLEVVEEEIGDNIFQTQLKVQDILQPIMEYPELNVLNYLKDNQCVNYTTTNKIIPSVLHWSLVDDNDYIFNVYPGFSGYYLDQTSLNTLIEVKNDKEFNSNKESDTKITIYGSKYRYDDTPNINSYTSKDSQNSLCWCNHVMVLNCYKNRPNILLGMYDELCKYATSFDRQVIHGIHYNTTGNLKMCFVGLKSTEQNILNEFDDRDGVFKYSDNQGYNLVFYGGSDTMLVFYQDSESIKNALTLKGFIDILNSLVKSLSESNNHKEFFERILQVLNSTKDKSQFIIPTNTLNIEYADSPSLSSTEIVYYKNDAFHGQPVLRLFGKIRPTFISENNDINYNFRYSKTRISPENLGEMTKFNNTKYSPMYPSINYYYIDNPKVENYNWPIHHFEKNSYNTNRILMLDPIIKMDLKSETDSDGNYKKLKELIRKYLMNYYDLEVTNTDSDETKIYKENMLDYIFSLYKYDSSFEYYGNDANGIKDYIYKVKIELK